MHTDFYLYLYTISVHPRESVSYFKAFKVLLCDRAKYNLGNVIASEAKQSPIPNAEIASSFLLAMTNADVVFLPILRNRAS
jgi:hypothetical protein